MCRPERRAEHSHQHLRYLYQSRRILWKLSVDDMRGFRSLQDQAIRSMSLIQRLILYYCASQSDLKAALLPRGAPWSSTPWHAGYLKLFIIHALYASTSAALYWGA